MEYNRSSSSSKLFPFEIRGRFVPVVYCSGDSAVCCLFRLFEGAILPLTGVALGQLAGVSICMSMWITSEYLGFSVPLLDLSLLILVSCPERPAGISGFVEYAHVHGPQGWGLVPGVHVWKIGSLCGRLPYHRGPRW